MSNINTNATVTLTVNGKQAEDMLLKLKYQAANLEKAIEKAAAAGIIIIKSASCFKNLLKRDCFLASASLFLPFFSSLDAASAELIPSSEEETAFSTSLKLCKYSFIFASPVKNFQGKTLV